jgi:hypothetical protein
MLEILACMAPLFKVTFVWRTRALYRDIRIVDRGIFRLAASHAVKR